MNLKDAIGYTIYRGSLAKLTSRAANFLLQARMVRGENVWRATSLVIENLQPSPKALYSIWQKLPEHYDKNFFMLHIMKTAGTSVKLSAARAIQLYDLTGKSLEKKLEESSDLLDAYAFWPFMSGHLHIDNFPKSHVGVTIFREPRGRFLSHYRQVQRLNSFVENNLVQPNKNAKSHANIPLNLYATNFSRQSWRYDCVWQFTSGHSRDHTDFLQRADENEIMKSIDLALDRIAVAGWTHDLDTFYRKFSEFLGRELRQEKRNAYPETALDEQFNLTTDDIGFIETITSREKALQSRAIQRGLMAPLAQSEADALFEQTAKRLNFKLP